MLPVTLVAQNQTELSAEAKENIIRLGGFLKRARFSASENSFQNSKPGSFSPDDLAVIKTLLPGLIKEVDFTLAFINSGIPQGASFSDETFRIIKGKILPYLVYPRDVVTVIHEIFNDSEDYRRLSAVAGQYADIVSWFSRGEKEEVLAVMQVQVKNAINTISYRIAALGMDDEMHIRAGKDEALISSFIEQNKEINELFINIEENKTEKTAEDMAQVKVMIRHCKENIALIDKAAEKNGTSLRQTFILRKLELLLDRIQRLLPLVCYEDTDAAFAEWAGLLYDIILFETSPKKLRDFISRNISLIAYRITENKRKTGEHYVAGNREEYFDLFVSACGGGAIVSFLVILKFWAHTAEFPLLWEALLYSVIYATGFVIIHVMDFTLATKQPAMTAAYIAASLDDVKDDAGKHQHFAATIATVSRSQLVSFAGNLVVAFPLTLFWAFIIGISSHAAWIEPERAEKLLLDIHPLYSLSFWYASITGVFLFLAGIISGFGDNKVVVSAIGLRLEGHPFLKKTLSANNRKRLASYIEKNFGPLMGNIALGFMLGMTGFIGKISGLPFDIRHITFSAGNMALGIYGLNFQLTISLLLACLTGVFIIGVLNFAVSFFLALQVAASSRGIRLKNYFELLKAVFVYFKNHPRDFFIPPGGSLT